MKPTFGQYGAMTEARDKSDHYQTPAHAVDDMLNCTAIHIVSPVFDAAPATA